MVKHPGKKRYQYRSAFEKMHMYGIKDKASVLQGLGYGVEEAKARIKQDILWENELFETPNFLEHVEAIVDFVYDR